MRTIEYAGKRRKVTLVLTEQYPDLGYSYVRKLLRKGDIKINGVRVKQDADVDRGDVIEAYVNEEQIKPNPLYDDENIAVFYKPKKTESQGERSFESVIRQAYGDDYRICHRLDTNTDGVLLFAKNNEVFEEIKTLFRSKSIEKTYYAIVAGALEGEGVFHDYLRKDAEKGRVYLYAQKRDGCREAITRYRAVEKRGDTTLVCLQPVTGRTHQLRAQLAYHGYPIVGDGKYGNPDINGKYREKTQRLTAYSLTFHVKDGRLAYLNGKTVSLDAPIL